METNEVQIVEQSALSEITRAEMESAMDIARRYPRNISDVKKKVLSYATCDQETAEACFYIKPVGKDENNKPVTASGPSIRLAEIVATTYGNIKYGSRVIEIGDKFVKVQGICTDVENNISFTSEVTRSIITKKGHKYSQQMIETTIKAASAIAIRDAIYKVVPMGIFNQEIKRIKDVGSGTVNPDGSDVDQKSLEERAKAAVMFFVNKQGVLRHRILNALNVKDESEMKNYHLTILTGYKTALKDGELDLNDAFPPTSEEQKKENDKKVQDDAKEKYIPKKKDKKDDPVEKFENEVKDKKDENPSEAKKRYTEEANKIISKLEILGITPKRVLSKYGFTSADQFDEESFNDLKSSHEGIVDKGFSHKEMFPLIDE